MAHDPPGRTWQYDFFISYAHFDEGIREFVETFVQHLRSAFHELTGVEARVFVDSSEISSAMLIAELSDTGGRFPMCIQRSPTTWLLHFSARLPDFEETDRFDLVICNGVLHYIVNKAGACRKLQRMTTPGGANVVSLWSDYSPVPDCHKVIPVYPDAERGAVYSAYAEWDKELLYFDRIKLESAHDDMDPHVHSHIKMVAIRGKRG